MRERKLVIGHPNLALRWNGGCLSRQASPGTIVIHSPKNIFITAVLGTTWMAALAFGARVMLKYETTAGPVGPVAAHWPSASIVSRSADKPTLVMLGHPHCPCTRASIAELAQIMAQAYGKANAFVLLAKPPGAGPEWDDTDLR